jgi:tetratricopeptide (TPR) repeat protein
VEAEREFQRAIELNPGYAEAHFEYSLNLRIMGRYDESIAEMRRAQALDPISPLINTQVGNAYRRARQYDQAIEEYHKVLEMDPNFHLAHTYLGLAYLGKGMHEEAIAEYQKGVDLSGGDLLAVMGLGYGYGVSGRRDEAMDILDELKERLKRKYIPPLYFAWIYMGLGEKDQAFEHLEKSYLERDPMLAHLRAPLYDSLRSDPRFTALLKKMNLE